MTDILVVGATGYTGRLISSYLSAHPDRAAHSLRLSLAGRSAARLADVLASLPDTTLVDVRPFSSLADLTADLAHTALVINVVGPYYIHTPTLAQECAKASTHYVDLSGEPHHVFSLIHRYNTHDTALATRSLIIPACGYDSIPSDLVAYLSARALVQRGSQPTNSTTVHSMRGGVSGGTIATALSNLSIPQNLLRMSAIPFASSPIVGPQPHPEPKLTYRLTIPGLKSFTGAFSPMSSPNTAIVQRSYGLLELHHLEHPDKSEFHYGSKFTYDEFMQVPNRLVALLYSSTIFTVMACLFIEPLCKLATLLLPPPGSGPTKKALEKGYFKATNFTFAASSDSTKTSYAKTTLTGQGDPGYLLTSIMISECALSILVPSDPPSSQKLKPKINPSLPPLAHSGGLLTPSTALGDVLIQRLVKTGKFTVDTQVLDVENE